VRNLLRRLDHFLERKWRETCEVLFYLADKKVEEDDIDWLNMANNMSFDEKKYWENRTDTYLVETKHIDKWKNEQNNNYIKSKKDKDKQ